MYRLIYKGTVEEEIYKLNIDKEELFAKVGIKLLLGEGCIIRGDASLAMQPFSETCYIRLYLAMGTVEEVDKLNIDKEELFAKVSSGNAWGRRMHH